MESPEEWRWIWVAGALLFLFAEMATPGSFFLLPFAVGAAFAALMAFVDIDAAIQIAAFLVISVATVFALRPLARRLDQSGTDVGIGAKRLLGQNATVLEEIPGGHELGLVRVDREQWRAESLDGSPIASGATVKVAEVLGTRVLVAPREQFSPPSPSEGADA
jgi:membrane protein implicated in regulation of membrane protease activity